MTEKPTIEDMFASIALANSQDEHPSPQTLPVKGLTVRLDSYHRARLAGLCELSGLSRQDILERFIIEGIQQAEQAYFGSISDSGRSQYYYDLGISEFLQGEGVSPDISDVISGIQSDIFENQENRS